MAHSKPEWWNQPAVPLQHHQHTQSLQPSPRSAPIIAVAFSIEQTGSDGQPKIRRGEDRRRSGHNRSCNMADQPHHHKPNHYVWLAQHTAGTDATQLHAWGHDHDGAYRQLPLNHPSLAYVLLLTPDGPTLWLHHVLLFGSANSVWSYNRFGDVLTSLSRVLTATPVVHFADDHGSINQKNTPTAALTLSADWTVPLGFHMKHSKDQAPQTEHKIQGAYIQLTQDTTIIRPCPQCIQHITQTILTALDHQTLDPSLAQKLSVFLHSHPTLWQSWPSSKPRPLPPRLLPSDHPFPRDQAGSHCHAQHSTPRQSSLLPTTTLTGYPKSHLHRCLLYHWWPQQKMLRTPDGIQHAHKDLSNGWGIVVFPARQTPIVTSGHIPPSLLQQFTSSQAFIYFLEPGQLSLPQSCFEPFSPNRTYNCATMRLPNTPS